MGWHIKTRLLGKECEGRQQRTKLPSCIVRAPHHILHQNQLTLPLTDFKVKPEDFD